MTARQTPVVDAAGNISLHGRQGLVITVRFATATAGVYQDISASSLYFEVDGKFRIALAAGVDVYSRRIIVDRTSVDDVVPGSRVPFALVDETPTRPRVPWSGLITTRGYRNAPPGAGPFTGSGNDVASALVTITAADGEPVVVVTYEGPPGVNGYTADFSHFAGIIPQQTIPLLCGDSTEWLLTQNNGYNYRMEQLTAPGQPLAGLAAWANMGSSGYNLNAFVNDGRTTSWTGPSVGNADWNFRGSKTGAYATMPTSMADLLAFLATLDAALTPIVHIGHGINDVGLNASVGNLSASALKAYFVALHRTACEAIHTACPRALIVLICPHDILPRPYTGVVPAASQYPTFGSNLANDVALVGKWNTAIYESKRQVASEYGYTAFWDWHTVAGYPAASTALPANYPYYVDNVHEVYYAAGWLADGHAQFLLGDTLPPNQGRLQLADAMVSANGGYALDYYARYNEAYPSRFTAAVQCRLVGCGSNYMDLALSVDRVKAGLGGATTLYIQFAGAAAQRFVNPGINASGDGTRLTGLAPTAAMQAASIGSAVTIYTDRGRSTGDAYVDGAAYNYVTNSNTYAASIAGGGSNYIDLSLDTTSDVAWPMECLQGSGRLVGLQVAIGAPVNATFSLSSGDGLQVNGTQIRIVNLGQDFTSAAGARAALLVPRGQRDPGSWASQLSGASGQSNAALVVPALTDAGVLAEVLYTGGACTVRLPTDASVAFRNGVRLGFYCGTAQTVTITAESGATLQTPPGRSGAMTGVGAIVWAYKRSANTWAISGDLV